MILDTRQTEVRRETEVRKLTELLLGPVLLLVHWQLPPAAPHLPQAPSYLQGIALVQRGIIRLTRSTSTLQGAGGCESVLVVEIYAP